MSVTIYENYLSKEPHALSVDQALSRIRKGKSKEVVDDIRAGADRKKDLPCVVFAGKISGTTRKDEDVIEHSGFFVLDWDGVNPQQKINQLKQDNYIYAAWVSPSANGVKALVRCTPSIEKHSELYLAFTQRYPDLDTTSKNISRLCYESYDPDIYINKYSTLWDKTITEEQYLQWRTQRENKRKQRIEDIAVSMIRNARVGERHDVILKAATLCGGHDRLFKEKDIIKVLQETVKAKGFPASELKTELKAVDDGYAHGKLLPIKDIKEIEHGQDFTRRADGTYDFLADEGEMDEYEWAYVNGTLEMGLSTNMPPLDKHWLFKKNTLVWFAGISNTGKSFIGWYLTVLAAMFYDWKFLIYAKENRDGQLRKKLKEFYIGKSVKNFTPEEVKRAEEFIKAHYRIFTSKRMHVAEDFLLKCEIVYDEGWEFDCVYAEPYNAFDVAPNTAIYPYNTHVLNKMQTFKENYGALWVSDHVGSDAARKKDKDGFIAIPWKSDVEMGAMKDNKADDFVVVHRFTTDPARKHVTELHVQKIKDVETGGSPTPFDDPVRLLINRDMCGFSANGIDPVKDYWNSKNNKPEVKLEQKAWSQPQEEETPPF